jgi:hypothetical protein
MNCANKNKKGTLKAKKSQWERLAITGILINLEKEVQGGTVRGKAYAIGRKSCMVI